MPYARKTLTQLQTDILNDINSAQITSSNGTVLLVLLQKAILRIMAYAQAGVGYEHYSELDWISLQAVPWTATDEFLEGWAGLKGVTREPATATVGTSTYTTTGPSVPSGTQITRSDGVLFASTTSTVTGSNVVVTMEAMTAGAAGNFDPNTTFTISNPVEGVLAQSTASTQTTAGADQELNASLRTRMLQAYAAPPQGGDRQDYIEWALAVSGVTRAWVAPNSVGAGTVTVYFMMDEAESSHGGFPQGSNGCATNETRDTAATGDQLTVANAIYPLEPITALVYANAPTAQPTNFTVSNLGSGNTTANQAAITAALQDMFLRLGNVGGTVQPQTGAAWPSIEPDAWYAAIEAVPGLSGFVVPTPSAAISPSTGNLLTLGTITFNA